MKKSLLIVALASMPAFAFAQDARSYQCALDELIRRVEVFSEPGVSIPCEVHYYKDTEAPGEPQVLWRAANEEGYCEARAAEFVARLEGMGWTCWEGSRPANEAEPDDTEALAPAEEEIEIPESDTPG